jgi:hypothetical protein
MPQLKITLPDDIRADLDRAATKSGKSLSQEIQGRLARSFEQDTIDKPTQDLLAAIITFDGLIQTQSGQTWHERAGANVALSAAIRARLARLRPPGLAVLPPLEGRTQFVATDDPAEMGVGLEALALRMAAVDDPKLMEQMEKDHHELTQMLKRKGRKP